MPGRPPARARVACEPTALEWLRSQVRDAEKDTGTHESYICFN
jgi:hypothetical protein